MKPSSSAAMLPLPHDAVPAQAGVRSVVDRQHGRAARNAGIPACAGAARALAFALLLLAGLCVAPAWAAPPGDDVDYLALAALLARDGEFERAAQALANVDPDAEATDRARYHTVRALIAQHDQRHADAADAFAAAIAAGDADPLLHLYRAQALFQLERYADAVQAIAAAGPAVEALSGAWLMRAHALWMLGERQQALDVLAEASARFPGNTGFQRRQLFYLIDAGLYAQAVDTGRDYLARAEGKAEDFVAIGTALRRARRFDEALRFLEPARLQFPDDPAIAKALAQTWLERGDVLVAAELLAHEANNDPSLRVEAAELFRRAGHVERALALNSGIDDPARKLKQRVGLLLAARRYDQVAALEAALGRAGLLADEDIRYALAYAHYSARRFDAAEAHLSTLTRPELFRRATELRRLMQECRDSPWSCA